MVSEKVKQQARKYYWNNREKCLLRNQEWSKNNKLKKRISSKKSQQKLRLDVIFHYSKGLMCCKCCGESILKFLTIDHPNNDGYKYKKLNGQNHSSHRLWLWLKKNNFPKGFQVQCYNCNLGRAKNNGICPHKVVLHL